MPYRAAFVRLGLNQSPGLGIPPHCFTPSTKSGPVVAGSLAGCHGGPAPSQHHSIAATVSFSDPSTLGHQG